MSSNLEIQNIISKLKCCVIIPTYNNEKTIQRVIDGVIKYTDQIIIVNDGCTDTTPIILEDYNQLVQIHFVKNKGKGAALRSGFNRAIKEGYDFAITIDSDGQHYPDDIPIFITELEKNQNILLIGSRNMSHDSVPKNSSFGNKFSNFWYWVETGIWLTDTQSGYRLYPLKTIENIKFYTNKFEFEIESIVKIAWRGLAVKNIPIDVLYDPNERVTHFRPIIDFTRISILNTWLVLVAFIYIKPRDFFRKLKQKGFKRFFIDNILNNSDSPIKKSISIALGIFIGIAPFWGFQTVLVLALASFFKLNKVIAFTFSNISIPPMIPFIIFGSMKLGSWVLGIEMKIDFENLTDNVDLFTNVKEYLIGSFMLATLSALFLGGLAFMTLNINYKKSE